MSVTSTSKSKCCCYPAALLYCLCFLQISNPQYLNTAMQALRSQILHKNESSGLYFTSKRTRNARHFLILLMNKKGKVSVFIVNLFCRRYHFRSKIYIVRIYDVGSVEELKWPSFVTFLLGLQSRSFQGYFYYQNGKEVI